MKNTCLYICLPVLLFLVSCQAAPPTRAQAGSEPLVQKARFERLFNVKGEMRDLVLVTRDFREDLELLERTTILAHHRDRYAQFDVVTFDRKHVGKDRIRHNLAAMWPIDLNDDPENRVLLLAEAHSEFLSIQVEADPTAGPPPPPPGILSLKVDIRFVQMERSGMIRTHAPKIGEVGRGIARVLETVEEDQPPLFWRLLLQFHLADRLREGKEKVKASAAYQQIIADVSHIRAGPDADDYDCAEFDLRNIDYVAEMAKKNQAKLE